MKIVVIYALLVNCLLVTGVLAEPLHRFSPLVQEWHEEYELNPVFEEFLPHIIRGAEISYHLAKAFFKERAVQLERFTSDAHATLEALKAFRGGGHSVYKDLASQHFDIYPFVGKSGFGNYHDLPGFISINREEGIMLIALRGSITENRQDCKDVLSRCLPPDWQTNLTLGLVDNSVHGLGIPGRLHRGFAMKASSLSGHFRSVFKTIFDSLSETERSRLLVFITGHSQGGAIGELLALQVIKELKGYNASFDNSLHNKVQIFRMASPLLGDEEAVAFMEKEIGKHNEIRLQMDWDPFPHLPFKFLGYKESGYLAYQHFDQAYDKVKGELPELEHDWLMDLQARLAVCHLSSPLRDPGRRFFFDGNIIHKDIRLLLKQGKDYEYSQKAGDEQSFWEKVKMGCELFVIAAGT